MCAKCSLAYIDNYSHFWYPSGLVCSMHLLPHRIRDVSSFSLWSVYNMNRSDKWLTNWFVLFRDNRSHSCPERTIKMTKPVTRRDGLYYRGSCIGITSQFLDCNRVGGQAAEEEDWKEKQRRAAGRQASLMDWAGGAGTLMTATFLQSLHTCQRHVWTRKWEQE